MSYTNRNFTWDFDALKRFYERYIVKWLNSSISWTEAQKKQARANLGFGDGDIVYTANQPGSDLDFSDDEGNVLVQAKKGHIRTKYFDSSAIKKGNLDETLQDELEQLSTDDAELVGSDLDFSDDKGNVVLRLVNGNIKTKNFNSASINETNLSANLLNRLNISDPRTRFSGKKIAIIGDSISTYTGWLPSDVAGYDGTTYATYYPRGDVNNVTKTWWYKLMLMLGLNPSTNMNNCAWSGSKVVGNAGSTTSAAAACSDRRVADVTLRFNGEAPDIIICWISANDWGKNSELGNWAVTDAIPTEASITTSRAAYAVMLNKLHTLYPHARIFCGTILDDFKRDETAGWPSNNANNIATSQWNDNIIEIAKAFGCEIIDFHTCGINYSNISQYYSVDEGLHPNNAGHTLIANKAYNELITKY